MIKIKCPCCGYFTQLVEQKDEPLFEICEVCFWQYDATAHDHPEISIGVNHISLNEARKNYQKYGICKKESKHLVRQPLEEELPIFAATAKRIRQALVNVTGFCKKLIMPK